ncbi:MAG TPA: ATP-binding protein [Methylomirabilota bacterium]|nr:ATP-binding protein [Methylomirabilota bacterium]
MSRRLRPLSIRTRLTLWYTSVLLSILLVISTVSYSILAWNLEQEMDASLLTVAHVLRDTGEADAEGRGGPEAALRDILGPEFYDKFFQLVDPQGALGYRSSQLRNSELPLSARARDAARHGRPTFETVTVAGGRSVRMVTLPVTRDGQLTQLVQVGIDRHRTERTLSRYVRTLVVLVPIGVALAAIGGALSARVALAPVNAISRAARRITAQGLARRIRRRGTDDELDQLSDTLNAMLARLEDAFSEMRRFTADAAHELRSPLTALKGGLEVALRTERTPEEYRQALASALEDVERLIQLAEDLLLLSRSRAGPGAEGAGARVELGSLVLDVFDVGLRLAAGRGVSIRAGEITPLVAHGDALGLRRALTNLVDNAVKYTPAGGTVEVSLQKDGEHATITVEDTGPGVDPPDAERIFQPFVRLDAARARDTGGAGLGLTIARAIAFAHGGTLTLEPRPDATGSRFVMRLPLE